MRNPEATRQLIIEVSAGLFNIKGYKATSINDITSKAKLTKGALYRHFKDKASLEQTALLYMLDTMMADIAVKVRRAPDARNKLYAILNYFASYAKKPHFEGGCPLLNAAVEADDNYPELRMVIEKCIDKILEAIVIILQNGIRYKQIEESLQVHQLAYVIFSQLEGAVMMIKIYGNDKAMKHCVGFLRNEINRYLI